LLARSAAPPAIVDEKYIAANRDERTQMTHKDADEQVVPVDDPFVAGGYECDAPGDPALPAQERVNCRSSVETVFLDDDQSDDSGNDDEDSLD
jgi:hypothetical protein